MELPLRMPTRPGIEGAFLSAPAGTYTTMALQPQGCSVFEAIACAGALAGCAALSGPAAIACVAAAAPGCVKCL